MREKLLDLMKNEGLKPSQLAELLEINPAGVSHILAGRNKPGFDLLQKILRRFPRISPDWLLLDSGPMYRTEPGVTSSSKSPANPAGLSGLSASSGSTKGDDLFGLFSGGATPESAGASPATSTTSTSATSLAQTSGSSHPVVPGSDRAAVTRVVIFYDDQTFEYYSPTQR